jgi:GntR family transcriptional regulator, negative regulator for fad regulon and positive regulator of fabA
MPSFDSIQKPLKPAEFAEKRLLEAILDTTYGPGDRLPAERDLARSLGVTRPTLRETLQRLSKEGWVTIAHGKPTQVNDYLTQGGLGVLATLSRYVNHITPDMTAHLLEARTLIFPGVAQKAAETEPDTILSYLETPISVTTKAETFARHDWGLQMLMVTITGNPVLKMMFNDFALMYHRLGLWYFANANARKISLEYYEDLARAINNKERSVHDLVQKTMARSQAIWQDTP